MTYWLSSHTVDRLHSTTTGKHKLVTEIFRRKYLHSDSLPLLSWTLSFPSERFISVRVDAIRSHAFPVNDDIPQGSVLAPTLFFLFTNDLLSTTSNPIHSLTDDSTVLFLITHHQYRSWRLCGQCICKLWSWTHLFLELQQPCHIQCFQSPFLTFLGMLFVLTTFVVWLFCYEFHILYFCFWFIL